MKYRIAIRIQGRYYVEVDADNLDEAVEKAETEFEEGSLDDMIVNDWRAIGARTFNEKGYIKDWIDL